LKPHPAKDYLKLDGTIPGLYVRVYRSGRKAWMFLSHENGRQRWHTIGDVHGALSPEDAALYGLSADTVLDLDNARHAASVCRAQVRSGRHPGDLRRDAIDAHRAEALEARTVRDVATIWLQEVIAHKNRRPESVQEMLDRHVLPHLGGMRIDRVKRAHVAEVIGELVKASKRVTANHALLTIKQLFRFAHERGYIEADPVAAFTRKSAGGKEKPRDRNLSFDELATVARAFWSPDFFAEPITRHALQFALLTGQRVGEIALAEWSHVDFDEGEWFIPRANTKADRDHVVHLSAQAIDVLREVQRHTRLLRFVFQSPRATDAKDARPVDPHSLARIVGRLFDDPSESVDPSKRNRAKPAAERKHRRIKRPALRVSLHGTMEPFTPHDLRRTMASRMADLGTAPHVIEKCLNHKLEGVLAVYQHAQWMPERKQAFERYGEKVATLLAADPKKVVQLPERRRA
jgi:integrase